MHIQYITGGAGTGKSHLLRTMLENETRPFVVCAPTGLAAMNVGGVTIHNGFRIDINGFVRDNVTKAPVRLADVIYIDESSMVSDKLMESMFECLERLDRVPDIIMFGDLAQLKPVQDSYFFVHRQPDEVTKLTKNYRQADDLTFANILNNIRQGKIVKDEITWINERAMGKDASTMTTMAFSNADVDKTNYQRLAALPGEAAQFNAEIEGNFNAKDAAAPPQLNLKVGARVMMLNNDRTGRWQNGSRATVKTIRKDVFDDDVIEVIIDNKSKNVHTIKPHTWTKEEPVKLTDEAARKYEAILDEGDSEQHDFHRIRKILRTGIDYQFVGSYTQFPVKLAYATTVHKAQGQTMEQAHILPDGFGNMHGLAYVALSRLTSIEGLSLSRKLNLFDFKFDKAVRDYL